MRLPAFCFLALGLAAGCSTQQRSPSDAVPGTRATEPVRNIILMIADGSGPGTWTAAAYGSEGELSVRRMPVAGLIDTRSASSKVTDSAAGASVLATGQRTTNRTISVGGTCPIASARDSVATEWPAGCEPLETWFAVARAKGKAAGIVTTTTVVDATPAAFLAHSPSRYWYEYIAEQVADARPDVLLGGGLYFFSADTRKDGRNLLSGLCAGADCLRSAADLAAYTPAERPLVGLFSPRDMDALDTRPVALPDMVGAALQRLARDPDGFVALFETEATDNAQHSNLPLERVTADILEFDRAVGVALDFAQRTPGTLVIVTADHDTGGLALAEEGTGFRPGYVTRGHTATLVPLFAFGPQAARFGGFRDNSEIGGLLMELAHGM